MISRICVFCGSSPGLNDEYKNKAINLGLTMVTQNITLVYGGAKVGLMGLLAKTVIENGGSVIGIMPEHLVNKEVAFKELEDLRVVRSMHERKAMMEELSDAFIAMPGGFGTFEEIFETITWKQLNLHNKPCGFLNIAGYYNKLFEFIDHAISEGFIHKDLKKIILSDEQPSSLLEKLKHSSGITIDKAKWALENNA